MSDQTELPETSEYRRWVETLPVELHGSLMVGDVVPTAFYSARRAGWDFDALVFDAKAAVNRGAGVGVLVERLRTLATTSPTVSKQGKSDVRYRDVAPERFTAANDPGRERPALMRRARAMTPDEAEGAMRDLNGSLAARFGVREGWRVPVRGWR